MKPSRELIKTDPEPTALDRPSEATGSPRAYNYGVDPNAESEVYLLDYWRAVRKRLWLVISIVVLVSMLSVIYVARKPDIYQAGARVQVDLENNAALVGKAPYMFGPTNDPVYFNTQLQILVSPGLMRRVVKTLDLEHNPNFFKETPLGSGLPGKPSNEWPASVQPTGRILTRNQKNNWRSTPMSAQPPIARISRRPSGSLLTWEQFSVA